MDLALCWMQALLRMRGKEVASLRSFCSISERLRLTSNATVRCSYGASSSGRGPPRAVEVLLRCSLKDLLTGTTKKIKITRKVPDGGDSSKLKQEEEVLEVKVQPGWKPGTRITFQGKGDHLPGRSPQVFCPSKFLLQQSQACTEHPIKIVDQRQC